MTRLAGPKPFAEGLRLAVVGKGGGGKSVIAGTLSRLLARRGARVLALDFDTVPGLAFTIGLPEMPNEGLPPALGIRSKRTKLARRIAASHTGARVRVPAPDGVRFLQLGKLPDGVKPGPSVAFRHVAETFRGNGWSIVGDLAAGTRQSFFGWARFAPASSCSSNPRPPRSWPPGA